MAVLSPVHGVMAMEVLRQVSASDGASTLVGRYSARLLGVAGEQLLEWLGECPSGRMSDAFALVREALQLSLIGVQPSVEVDEMTLREFPWLGFES